jgi:hypothetical protein
VEIKPPACKIREDQIVKIMAICGEMGLSIPAAEKQLPAAFGCTQLSDLNENQAFNWIQQLEGQKKVFEQKKAAAKAKADREHAATNGVANPVNPSNPAEARMSAPPATAPVMPTTPTTPAYTELPPVGGILDEQKAAIVAAKKRLMELGLTDDQYRAALAKRGVTSATQFTHGQAAEFIEALNKKGAQLATTAQKATQGTSPN